MTFPDLFSSQAATYAKYRPEYPDALFRYLASVAPRSEVAWDCGTGNGQAARALAAYFEKVVATDASEGQIRQAKAHPKVEYLVAPAEHSGLPSHFADLVTVAQALHWFSFDEFFAEASRVMKSDAVIAVWCYGNSKIEPGIDAITEEFYSETLDGYWDDRRRHIDDGFSTIPFPFEETKAPAFTLECEWTAEQYVGYLESWSAFQAFLKRNPGEPSPLKDVAARLNPIWNGRKKVRWPLSVRLGKKRKP